MSEDKRDVWVKWTVRTLVLAIVGIGCFMSWPSYQRTRLLKRQVADLDQRIAQKHKEIKELQENKRRFKSDADFVESIARKNKRVFPGELLFLFEDK